MPANQIRAIDRPEESEDIGEAAYKFKIWKDKMEIGNQRFQIEF